MPGLFRSGAKQPVSLVQQWPRSGSAPPLSVGCRPADRQGTAHRVGQRCDGVPRSGPFTDQQGRAQRRLDEFGPLGIRPTAGSYWAEQGRSVRLSTTGTRMHGVTCFHGCYSVGDDTLRGVNRRRKGTANTARSPDPRPGEPQPVHAPAVRRP
ncbi:hypothetical protein GCM10020367_63440 [Streptomyces sannanensis]|uniref:Uncharacterized protein n=1 Tax=Streptomyces sannanensis TaxID=285536 RepID=A0ABP6SLE7_9ACTN